MKILDGMNRNDTRVLGIPNVCVTVKYTSTLSLLNFGVTDPALELVHVVIHWI